MHHPSCTAGPGSEATGAGGAAEQQVNWSLSKHLCLLSFHFLFKDSCSKRTRKSNVIMSHRRIFQTGHFSRNKLYLALFV